MKYQYITEKNLNARKSYSGPGIPRPQLVGRKSLPLPTISPPLSTFEASSYGSLGLTVQLHSRPSLYVAPGPATDDVDLVHYQSQAAVSVHCRRSSQRTRPFLLTLVLRLDLWQALSVRQVVDRDRQKHVQQNVCSNIASRKSTPVDTPHRISVAINKHLPTQHDMFGNIFTSSTTSSSSSSSSVCL